MRERKKHRRQDMWDKLHLATCSCRIRKSDYRMFRVLCGNYGMTVNECLRKYVGQCLIDSGAGYAVSADLRRTCGAHGLQYTSRPMEVDWQLTD